MNNSCIHPHCLDEGGSCNVECPNDLRKPAAQSIAQSGKPVTPAVAPAIPDWGDDDDLCAICGGDGYILACDGDGNDWGEDTYSGQMDAVIECRHCKGTGVLS